MSGTQRRSVILGTGSELPAKVVTNRDLEKMVDTSDEWITVRTGIKERRVLEAGKGNADMAFQAAKRALADAGMEATDLDAIIMGTVSADYLMPSSACVLEDMLGARNVFSFDVGAACSGFLNALSVADSFVRTGKINNGYAKPLAQLARSRHVHSFRRRRRRGSARPVGKWLGDFEHQAPHRRLLRQDALCSGGRLAQAGDAGHRAAERTHDYDERQGGV